MNETRQKSRASRLAILGQRTEVPERADAARNRVAILDAARKLLRKRPIGDICMDELAEAAGVGKGTLYRRFEDRASLCRALLDDNAAALQAEVLRGFDLPATATWLEHITRLLDALFEFTAENASLLSEAVAYERGVNKRFEHPAYRWQHDTLVLYMTKAREAGELDVRSPHPTADFVLTALDPDLIRWHLDHGRPLAGLLEDFRAFWQLGLLGTRVACAR